MFLCVLYMYIYMLVNILQVYKNVYIFYICTNITYYIYYIYLLPCIYIYIYIHTHIYIYIYIYSTYYINDVYI